MDWTQIITIVLSILGMAMANFGIFLWSRSESREDARFFAGLLKDSEMNTQNLISAIREDIKDFHGRLCAIEERRKERK